ncbi:MAG: alginate export family protein [Planctomycetota bacterium]
MDLIRPACSTLTALFVALATQAATTAQETPKQDDGPWRLSKALDTPEWFSISGSVDLRYESLDKRLREGESGNNHGVFTRALVEMSLRDTYLGANLEIIDARIFYEPDDARVTTGQVDTVEVLQGYVDGRFQDVFAPGDRLRVQAGRHTMDVGSRRFVARNIFRNTINAFTGLNAQWESQDGATARAFFTLPVQRLPGGVDIDKLRDGEIEFDEERSSVRFFGLVGETPRGPLGASLQGYVYGLDESDADGLTTRDRDLTTVGFRLNRPPASEEVHFELESAYQFGESRASGSATEDLDHRAYLHHLTVGYTLPGEMNVRFDGLFDYASGDRDPSDGRNERFDSLFGVPRGEYGPTGLFREIARANVVSPGLRVTLRPADRWAVMALFRANYLASDRDAWTTTGIQDPTGRSGSHIGDLTELRVRYALVPKVSRLEFGVAYHSAGGFAETASTGNGGRDALYGYVQTTFWF